MPTANPGTAAFEEFANHVAVQSLLIAGGLDSVATDASNLDLDALVDSSVSLWLDLGDEELWLEEHPPAACFTELHGAYSDAISLLYAAMDLISDGAIQIDSDLLIAGTELMTEGTAVMEAIPAMVDDAVIACA